MYLLTWLVLSTQPAQIGNGIGNCTDAPSLAALYTASVHQTIAESGKL